MPVDKQGTTQQGHSFQTCLNKDSRPMFVHKQGTTIQTCLNTGCKLMLVRQPVIIIQRVGDRRMSACKRWMRGLKSTTLLSMPPVPLFELHIFHPDTNARSKIDSSRIHLHYPSQKRWLPGVRGIRKPPRKARRGAPASSHESLVGCFPTNTNQPTGSQLLQTQRES